MTEASSDVTASQHRIERARAVLGGLDLGEVPSSGTSPTVPRRAASSPAVTVVVPCWNEERFVHATLESVRAQTFQDWECVVVDDASTDASAAVVADLVRAEPRLRVERHELNRGLSAARNTGLRVARGEHVTFLDADDLLLRESIDRRLAAILAAAEHPTLAGTYCGFRTVPEEAALDDFEPWINARQQPFVDFVSAAGECPFIVHQPLVSTSLVRALGGFDPTMLDGAEDWDLWLRMLRNGCYLLPSGGVGVLYRQKGGSMVREKAAAHAAIGVGLIDRAFGAGAPSELLAPVEGGLPRPLPEYQRDLLVSRRLVRSATRDWVAGSGREGAEATLALVPALPPSLFARHVDVERCVTEAARNALGLTVAEAGELDRELRKLVSGTLAVLALLP